VTSTSFAAIVAARTSQPSATNSSTSQIPVPSSSANQSNDASIA
jgi:hypothetical protein